ncbi:MAG TPA: MAPEG family protein [Afifellaceae bacterium]|nr:MAPEG family protein [Afifellaceae bacterium]
MSPDSLSYEFRMLAYSAFLCLVLWIPYILATIQTRGLAGAVGYPTGKYDDLPEWAQRNQRAHMNMVENLAPFAALVLLAHLAGQSSGATAFGAALFFWARLAHAIVHIAGIPWARTILFTVAWLGNLIIFWEVVT